MDCTGTTGKTKRLPVTRKIRACPAAQFSAFWKIGVGRLWLSTKKGISRFDPQTGNFRNYDVSDGLQSNEFSQACYTRRPDGEMFFGGSNGIQPLSFLKISATIPTCPR